MSLETPSGLATTPTATISASAGLRDDTSTTQSQQTTTDEAGMIGSLGDAFAGVNLGFPAPVSSSSSDERREPTSAGNPFNVGGAHATTAGSGWGGFSNPEASRNSFARPNSNNDGREDSARNTSQPANHLSTPERVERKQSIDLFLSRSPSQMLGNDVFKLSTGNLPGLVIPEDAVIGVQVAHGGSVSPANYDSAVGILSNQEQHQRRGSPSSNVTGATTSTTTGSRSNSPYESVNAGGRTIQAYHGYDAQVSNNGVNASAVAYNPVTPGATPGSSFRESGSVSSHHLDNGVSPRLNSPYSTNMSSNNNMGFNGYDSSPASNKQHTPQVTQTPAGGSTPGAQQQILYMAVPTPDGRGQVLQPIQIMQMPGKQFAYVVPGADGMPGMQGGMPPIQGAAQPMMVMPSMMPQQGQIGSPGVPPQQGIQSQSNDLVNGLMSSGGLNALGQNKNLGLGGYPGSPTDPYTSPLSGGLGPDEYGLQGQGGLGGDSQYLNQPTDPSLASLYSTPQRPPLDALLGQVRRLSRDQVGCRLVQQALDEEGPMAATLILNEGLPFWGEAMVDPFGNYLFQKILEKITSEERIMLVKSVSTRLVNASLNLHGTRSVQKIVELCAMDEERKAGTSSSENPDSNSEETAADVLTKALAPAAARLCIDSHGNHVIQRILLKLGHKHSKFVFDAVAESVGDVARHRHGCCVIQRCLDSQPGPARSHLVRRIVDKSLELMQDAYGNYVVQYVLDVCSDDDVHAVCESVIGKVNLLAIQKFSSNVMEKCLERCTDRVKEHYMQELSDPERIRELMMDPFGNYVVQRALSVATHTQAVRLVEAMRPHLISQAPGTPNGQRNGGVRNTAGGRRIMAKICRRFPNFNLNATGSREELYSQNRRHHQNAHSNPTPTLPPMYGMAQLSPGPVQILHQQPQQHHHQLYGSTNPNLDYSTNSLSVNPLNMGGFQIDQHQQYYDIGADPGYFQQHTPHFGQGAYPSGL